MSLNFPNQPEVRLNRSPLSEVICQVKFPPILKIGESTPADFQDKIRKRFPLLEVEQQVLFPVDLSQAVEKPEIEKDLKLYRFKSADEKSSVALAANFFALSTKAYSHWGNFNDDLQFIEDRVCEEFQPAFATRIGLRFINKLTLENTGSKTLQDLVELLRDELTCLIRLDVWNDPRELITQIILPDRLAKLVLRVGFAYEQSEPYFLLDFDYFEEYQLDFLEIANRISHYHDQIYQAFRWCLKEQALERFVPIRGK